MTRFRRCHGSYTNDPRISFHLRIDEVERRDVRRTAGDRLNDRKATESEPVLDKIEDLELLDKIGRSGTVNSQVSTMAKERAKSRRLASEEAPLDVPAESDSQLAMPRRGGPGKEPTEIKTPTPEGGTLQQPDMVVFPVGATTRRRETLSRKAIKLAETEKTPYDDVPLPQGGPELAPGATIKHLETEVRRPVPALQTKGYNTEGSGWNDSKATSWVAGRFFLPDDVIQKINDSGFANAKIYKGGSLDP